MQLVIVTVPLPVPRTSVISGHYGLDIDMTSDSTVRFQNATSETRSEDYLQVNLDVWDELRP